MALRKEPKKDFMRANLKLLACASAASLMALTGAAQEITTKPGGTEVTQGGSTAERRLVRLGTSRRK